MTTAIATLPKQPPATDARRTALLQDPFEPQTLPELLQFAERVATTEFAPKEFRGKPNDCFIAMVYGRNLGLGALQALQGVCVINGKPSVYGETFWAVILSHPEFDDCIEKVTAEQAEITLKRRGRAPGTFSFSMAEAQTAGLKGKAGPWTTYPKGQLLWRARHRGAVALFADALKGIIPREVALDYQTIEGTLGPGDIRSAAPTASTVEAGTVVTPALAGEWSAAVKAAGIKVATARENLLKKEFGIETSLQIRTSQIKRAFEWIKEQKPEPAQATATVTQDQPAQATAATIAKTDPRPGLTPEEEALLANIDAGFSALGMDLIQQANLRERFKDDLPGLKAELGRLADEGAAN